LAEAKAVLGAWLAADTVALGLLSPREWSRGITKRRLKMGLDMYAYAVPRHLVTQPVDFDTDDLPSIEFHYWRKHPNLHGWMRDLYYSKGGQDRDFNCVPVELTVADLEALRCAIMDKSLPPTAGFFFGESDGSERDDDMSFLYKANHMIEQGFAVYYTSWW
jgi:hypothetical protein